MSKNYITDNQELEEFENYLKNISNELQTKYKEEGKYNYWFTAYDFKSKTPYEPILSEVLPVFGDPDKYVTKWFYSDKEQAMREAVRRLKKLL